MNALDNTCITEHAAKQWSQLCKKAIAQGERPVDGTIETGRIEGDNLVIEVPLQSGKILTLCLGPTEWTWAN